MKKTFMLLFWISFCLLARSQDATLTELTRVSTQLMKLHQPEAVLRGTDGLGPDAGRPVGYLFRFAPTGFVITSTSELIRPVYAYSFSSDFNLPEQQWQIILEVFSQDLQNRIRQAGESPENQKRLILQEWNQFLSCRLPLDSFQQWPPEGTTSTGGWLESNWTQSAPYNGMCPMDLNAGQRSVAGCPAIAMGQIVNYHRTLNDIAFDDSDDYYHSYGSGNQYWIDDDHQARGFPSWDSLNFWLDSLQYVYQEQQWVTSEMKAALCFACGVAAHQVYTASVSGTFGIDQAWEALQRFDFTESRLIFPEDTNLNSEIAENIKMALPVQLGLLVAPPGSGGHNVVVDGYNTNEFYHFNFGWGGSANGWYTLPPTSIAYNLTIIEGAVLDIKSSNITGLPDEKERLNLRMFPNPASAEITIAGDLEDGELILYNLTGVAVVQHPVSQPNTRISVASLPAGIYLVRVLNKGMQVFTGKLVKE